VRAGVFRMFWRKGLLAYDEHLRIAWRWQSADGAMTKAPLGGGKNRPKSHRPRKEGRQTRGADRRSWSAAGRRDRGSQPERFQTPA
jgi:hypothetical protein